MTPKFPLGWRLVAATVVVFASAQPVSGESQKTPPQPLSDDELGSFVVGNPPALDQSLNDSAWTIRLHPQAGKPSASPSEDTLVFMDGLVHSTRSTIEGFEPATFLLGNRLSGGFVWEGIQKHPNGAALFWFGELQGDRMIGTLKKQAGDHADAFTFQGTRSAPPDGAQTVPQDTLVDLLHARTAELDEAQANTRRASGQIRRLQDDLSAEQTHSKQLEQDLSRIQSHVDGLDKAVGASTKSVEDQLAQTEQRLTTLRADLDAQRAAYTATQREREKLLKDLESVRAQLAERDAALKTASKDTAQLTQKHAQAQDALADARARAATLEQQLTRSASETSTQETQRQAELEEAQQSWNRLKVELERVIAERDRADKGIRAELVQLQDTLAKERVARKELDQALQAQKDANLRLTTERDEAAQGRRHLQVSYDQSDAQRVEIQRQLSELREQHRVAQQRAEETGLASEALTQQLTEARRASDTALTERTQLQELHKTLGERERVLTEAKARVAKLEEQLTRTTGDVEEQNRQRDAKLEEAQQSWNRLKVELERVIAERDRADKGIRAELVQLQDTLAKERVARKELDQALQTQKDTNVRLATEHEKAQSDLSRDRGQIDRDLAALHAKLQSEQQARQKSEAELARLDTTLRTSLQAEQKGVRAVQAGQQERDRVQKTLAERDRAVMEAKARIENLEKQLAGSAEKAASPGKGRTDDQQGLQNRLAKAETDLHDEEQARQLAESELARLRETLKQDQARLRQTQAQPTADHAQLEQQVARLTKERDTAVTAQQRTQTSIARAQGAWEEERLNLNRKLHDAMQAERDAAITSRGRVDHSPEQFKAQILKLQEQVASLAQEREKLRSEQAREQNRGADELATLRASLKAAQAAAPTQEPARIVPANAGTATLHKQLETLTEERDVAIAARKRAQAQLAELKQEMAALTNERGKLQDAQGQRTREQTRLEDQLAAAQTNMNRLKIQLAESKEQLGERGAAQRAHDTLVKELATARADHDRELDARQDAERALAALRTERTEAVKTVEQTEAQRQLAKVQQQLAEAQQQLARRDVAIDNVQDSRNHLKNELDRTIAERDRADAAYTALKQEGATARQAQTQQVDAGIAALQRQVAALTQERESLRNEQAQGRGEQEFAQLRVQLEEDQRIKVASLQEELVRLAKARDAALTAQQRAQTSIAASQASWEAEREADQRRLLTQIAELQHEVAALTQERETIRHAEQQRVQSAEGRAQTQLRELQTALADSQRQLDAMQQEQVPQDQAALDDARRTVGALKKSLEGKDRQLAEYQEALANLADHRVADAAGHQQGWQRLQERLAILEAQRDAAREELVQAKRPLVRAQPTVPPRHPALLERSQESPRLTQPSEPMVLQVPAVTVSAQKVRDRSIAMETALWQLERQRARAKPVQTGPEWPW